MSQKLVYTIPEAAEELRISRAGLYNAINRGELKVFKIGRSTRISADALAALMSGEADG